MKLTKKIVWLLLILSAVCFSQKHHIMVGVYGTVGLSLSASYYYNLDSTLFLSPNYSATITKEGKEIYSFENYSIDIGYNFYKTDNGKNYISIGASYINFLHQNREGHSGFISDIEPPYYYHGETKENCFGVNYKLGFIGNLKSWFLIGFEIKYSMYFPKVKYNYEPKEYSEIRGPETKGLIFFGLFAGIQF